MTVRLAMDALADILGQQLGMKADGRMAFHSRTPTWPPSDPIRRKRKTCPKAGTLLYVSFLRLIRPQISTNSGGTRGRG
jgi:hypothetical protein